MSYSYRFPDSRPTLTSLPRGGKEHKITPDLGGHRVNISLLASGGLIVCWFAIVALPGLARPGQRKWVGAVILIAAIDFLATISPDLYHGLRIPGEEWNWSGKLIDLAVLVAISAVLIRSGAFRAQEFGLTLRQAPGTMRGMAFVILPYFLLLAVLTATLFGQKTPPDLQNVAFEATMPGLAEELSFRGIQLALFDRMFKARFRLLGAEMGYGAIVTSIIFGLVHGLGFDKHMALQFSAITTISTGTIGFVLAWTRARTQSLVMPVIVHNITNLIFICVPLLT